MNWQFWGEHCVLAFWAMLFAAIIVYSMIELTIKLGARVLRTINIVCRGWPPEHLDADGDWEP